MVVFKAELKKYAKSVSTWVIFLVAAIILIAFGVVLPMNFLNLNASTITQDYQLTIIASTSSIGVSLSLISAVFAAFKASQIYRAEIEDGTFLVTLSKPMSRTRIVSEKWIAMIVMITIYVGVLMILYDIFVFTMDVGPKIPNLSVPTLSSIIFSIGGILFLIVLLLTLLFSSISLIISTKLGVASTIAFTSFLGIIIPITGFIPTFTVKKTNTLLSSQSILGLTNAPQGQNLESINTILKSSDNSSSEDLKNILTPTFNESQKTANSLINIDNNIVSGLSFQTGSRNAFEKIFPIDLNYQLKLISSYSGDLLTTPLQRQALAFQGQSSTLPDTLTVGKTKVIEENIEQTDFVTKMKNSIKYYKNFINTSDYIKFSNLIVSFLGKTWGLEQSSVDAYNKLNENSTTEERQNATLKFFSELIQKSGATSVSSLNQLLSKPVLYTLETYEGTDPAINNLKSQLKTQQNLKESIASLDSLFAISILINLNRPLSLLFNNISISEYFNNSISDGDKPVDRGSEIISQEDAMSEIKKEENSAFAQFYENDLKQVSSPGFENNPDLITLANLAQIVNNSSQPTSDLNKIQQVSFESYANRNALTAIYAIVTLLLAPLSFYIVKKQDVR